MELDQHGKSLNSRSVAELREICKQYGVNAKGRKHEIINRLREALSTTNASNVQHGNYINRYNNICSNNSSSSNRHNCSIPLSPIENPALSRHRAMQDSSAQHTRSFLDSDVESDHRLNTATIRQNNIFVNNNTITNNNCSAGGISSSGSSSSSSNVANKYNLLSGEFCYCSLIEKSSTAKLPTVKCRLCGSNNHRKCVRYEGSDSLYMCPHCKLLYLDPFFAPLQTLYIGRCEHSYILSNEYVERTDTSSSIVEFDSCELRSWRSNNMQIVVRCVAAHASNMNMEWPKTFTLKANQHVETIAAPTWEHKRRDTPLTITQFLHSSPRTRLVLAATNYDKEPKLFVVGIFLCRPVSDRALIKSILEGPNKPYDLAKRRVIELISDNPDDDDDVECMETNRRIKLTCPITLMRMTTPVRGQACRHLQCFGLESYMEVTRSTRAFNTRWRCPECHLYVRPEELEVDAYVEDILRRTDEDEKIIEILGDGNWRVVTETELKKEKEEEDKKSVAQNPIMEIVDEAAAASANQIECYDISSSDDEDETKLVNKHVSVPPGSLSPPPALPPPPVLSDTEPSRLSYSSVKQSSSDTRCSSLECMANHTTTTTFGAATSPNPTTHKPCSSTESSKHAYDAEASTATAAITTTAKRRRLTRVSRPPDSDDANGYDDDDDNYGCEYIGSSDDSLPRPSRSRRKRARTDSGSSSSGSYSHFSSDSRNNGSSRHEGDNDSASDDFDSRQLSRRREVLF